MPRKKIWDSRHQGAMIRVWIKNGLILKEGETYKDIYYYVMSIDNCQLCSVKFNKEVHNEWRCMDHDHKTGYFRQVLCHKCNHGFDRQLQINNKTGYKWISRTNRSNNRIYYRYQRKGFKPKSSVSFTKMMCLSFINLLKVPI